MEVKEEDREGKSGENETGLLFLITSYVFTFAASLDDPPSLLVVPVCISYAAKTTLPRGAGKK